MRFAADDVIVGWNETNENDWQSVLNFEVASFCSLWEIEIIHVCNSLTTQAHLDHFLGPQAQMDIGPLPELGKQNASVDIKKSSRFLEYFQLSLFFQ